MRIACTVLGAVILFAVAAPLWARSTGHAPGLAFPDVGLSPDGAPTGPGGTFWLGADALGRDVLVRASYGARVSLLVAFGSTLAGTVLGVAAGVTAGYLGGAADALLSRAFDVVLSFPYLLAAMATAAVLGAGIPVTIAVIGLSLSAQMARTVRSRVLEVRETGYVEAARALGATPARIMASEILPGLTGPIAALAVLMLPAAVTAESTLAFLGAGAPASWGAMLAEAQDTYRTAWWTLIVPAALLLTTTLAAALIADRVTRTPTTRPRPNIPRPRFPLAAPEPAVHGPAVEASR